jgi:hypothetical protein
MGKIVRRFPTIDGHRPGRCKNPNCICRRTRDAAPMVRTKVTSFTNSASARYSAELVGDELTIYVTQPGLDSGEIIGAGNGLEGPVYAGPEQVRQPVSDAQIRASRKARDESAKLIDRMNAKAAARWPKSPAAGAP